MSVDVPAIYVLAPDHVGLTLQQQAALYWYQSKPSNLQSELLMGTDDQPAPVLSLNKPQAAEAGMVKIDLLKHDVYLEKGGVALVVEPKNRSRDVLATGFNLRTNLDARLSTRLVQKNRCKTLQLLAGFGIWYDALATFSQMIEVTPDDRPLRAWRATLLDQVDLTEAASFDQIH